MVETAQSSIIIYRMVSSVLSTVLKSNHVAMNPNRVQIRNSTGGVPLKTLEELDPVIIASLNYYWRMLFLRYESRTGIKWKSITPIFLEWNINKKNLLLMKNLCTISSEQFWFFGSRCEDNSVQQIYVWEVDFFGPLNWTIFSPWIEWSKLVWRKQFIRGV